MAGMRVLDLTRVIAGPVATRTLALLGADVLRVDGPRHPEIEAQHLDTGLGKRSTILDLDRTADRATFDELLGAADVVVTGYRPGSLDRHGLAPCELLLRHPRLVVATLSAWGTSGPWGVLPAQALDHGTGYLLAATVMRALAARYDVGSGQLIELALARTAKWLFELADQAQAAGEPRPRWSWRPPS